MRRLPVVPTILVALAIAAMVGLGFWQLGRLHQKEALLRQYAINARLPEMALPRFPVGDRYLFRRAAGFCLKPVGWQRSSGRDRAGNSGWRQIAHCATGAEDDLARRAPGTAADRRGRSAPDHGFAVQLGIADQAEWRPTWAGGVVRGFLTQAPSTTPAILSAFGGGAPKQLLLVADTPPPGLRPNAGADLSSVPNNHLAYAVQWFLFAAIAGVIYALALRGRGAKPVVQPGSQG